jgi:hypothetical protein
MSDQSSSLLRPKDHINIFPDVLFNQSEIVDTITINDWVKQYNIDRIDFMWLDLQGNEMRVLSKADLILHTTKVIYAEYSLVEFYEGLTLYEDFKKFMDGLGFKEEINDKYFNYLNCGNSLFIR